VTSPSLVLSRLLSFVVLFFIITPITFGQDCNNFYKINKVADKVWVIVENDRVNIYLVEGKDSALIIDTGYGFGDLKAYVQTLTKLPLIVVNTHVHLDHAGNDHQFAMAYAHPEDFGLINTVYGKEVRRNNILSRTKDKKWTDEELNKRVDVLPPTFIPVKEGHIFDLGDRRLEVIEVPGHTHGSICLLDSANKILFAGDNINAVVWLFLKESCPLEGYLESLQKVEKRINEFNIILPGHNTPLDKTFIYEQIACVKSILKGTCSPIPFNYSSINYSSIRAGALSCKYKTFEVVYAPNNLYKKDNLIED